MCRVRFSLVCLALACAAVFVTAAVGELAAQPAVLMGRVLDQNGERPLAGATVELTRLDKRVLTDSTGAFRMDSVPPGRQQVAVRLIGFDPVNAEVRFVRGETIDTDFLLASNAQRLAPVLVDTTRTPLERQFMRDFDDRRAMGMGRYLDTEFFKKNDYRDIRSVLPGAIPGLRIRRVTQMDVLEGTRNGIRCFPQVIVNNMIVYNGTMPTMFDLATVNTRDILGVEYYGAGNAPLRFKGTGGGGHGPPCGTLIFWMK